MVVRSQDHPSLSFSPLDHYWMELLLERVRSDLSDGIIIISNNHGGTVTVSWLDGSKDGSLTGVVVLASSRYDA